MKHWWKEAVLSLLQLGMFYLFPLFAAPFGPMGMVFLILLATLALSLLMGALSGSNWKYLYPAAVAVVFLPTVFLYYNDSALIHAVWYLVVSGIGLLVGAAGRLLLRLFQK